LRRVFLTGGGFGGKNATHGVVVLSVPCWQKWETWGNFAGEAMLHSFSSGDKECAVSS
jgi:hypothetical protein